MIWDVGYLKSWFVNLIKWNDLSFPQWCVFSLSLIHKVAITIEIPILHGSRETHKRYYIPMILCSRANSGSLPDLNISFLVPMTEEDVMWLTEEDSRYNRKSMKGTQPLFNEYPSAKGKEQINCLLRLRGIFKNQWTAKTRYGRAMASRDLRPTV